MAAGKFKVYETSKQYIGNGTHDLDDITNWKCALFLGAVNFNRVCP